MGDMTASHPLRHIGCAWTGVVSGGKAECAIGIAQPRSIAGRNDSGLLKNMAFGKSETEGKSGETTRRYLSVCKHIMGDGGTHIIYNGGWPLEGSVSVRSSWVRSSLCVN